jgi:hypothetical protein
MATDERIPEESDPKPFKVWRINDHDEQIEKVAEYATEAGARAHNRRLDWKYAYYKGRTRLE